MSRIIVLEGADRCGKATQSGMLCEHIKSLGKSAVVVEVPIKDLTTYNVIYWLLGNGLAKKLPKTFQWLQCLNRWIFQTLHLVSLEHSYDYIIFDRWSLSTTVYGRCQGMTRSFVDKLFRMLRKPDHTLLLIGPSHTHTAEDVYEKDTKLQSDVKSLYVEWASENPDTSTVVKCDQTRQEVHDDILRALQSVGLIPTQP